MHSKTNSKPAPDIAADLMPPGYHGEPSELPGVKLIWVAEIRKFAIVRFFTDVTGANRMVPIRYFSGRGAADRRLADYHRALDDYRPHPRV